MFFIYKMCRRQKEWQERQPKKAISNKEVVASAGSEATLEVAARLTLSISQRAQHLNVERRLKPRVPLLPFKHRVVSNDIGDIKVESEKSRVAAFSLDVSLI